MISWRNRWRCRCRCPCCSCESACAHQENNVHLRARAADSVWRRRGDGVQARSWAWVLRAQSVQESSGLNVFVVSLCGTTSWRRQHHHHRCRRHRHRRLPPVAVLLLRLRRRRCGRYCCCCAFYFGNWVLKVFASSRRSAFLLSLLCSRPQSLRRHRFRNYDPIRIFWLQISFWTISTKCQMSSVELMS